MGTYIHAALRESSGIHFDRFFQAINIFLAWKMGFSKNTANRPRSQRTGEKNEDVPWWLVDMNLKERP